MNNFELIQHVKIRRAVWDNSLWDRIDSAAREVMWEDIAEQMNSSKEIVKARWKNLKDAYRKLLLRSRSLPGQSAPKWRYFGYLDFIKDFILNSKGKVKDISLRDFTLPDQSYITHEDTKEESESGLEDPLAFSNNISEPTVKNSNKRKYSNGFESEYEIPDYSGRNPTNYANDDDMQFLLSLHPHIKQVPRNKKLLLRMSIEKMIYDEIFNSDIPDEGSI